jgi:hypothetical protein
MVLFFACFLSCIRELTFDEESRCFATRKKDREDFPLTCSGFSTFRSSGPELMINFRTLLLLTPSVPSSVLHPHYNREAETRTVRHQFGSDTYRTCGTGNTCRECTVCFAFISHLFHSGHFELVEKASSFKLEAIYTITSNTFSYSGTRGKCAS